MVKYRYTLVITSLIVLSASIGVFSTIIVTSKIQSEHSIENKARGGNEITRVEEPTKVPEKVTDKGSSLTQTELEDLIAVQRLVGVYPNTSKDKGIIVSAILRYAKEYQIDPVTLTALLAKESSMDKNAKHSTVFVKIPIKKNWTKVKTAKVNAQGMGGVIYEIWKYELCDIGIKSKNSLSNLETNIKASAFILGVYTHEKKKLKFTETKEESALLRYYGVIRNANGIPDKTYANQVYDIIKQLKI